MMRHRRRLCSYGENTSLCCTRMQEGVTNKPPALLPATV